MTDTLFRCIIIALFFACAGLLALLHGENERLVRARRRTAAVVRRLKRDRDAREESYQAAVEVAKEEIAKSDALTEELAAYWNEDEAKGLSILSRLN